MNIFVVKRGYCFPISVYPIYYFLKTIFKKNLRLPFKSSARLRRIYDIGSILSRPFGRHPDSVDKRNPHFATNQAYQIPNADPSVR